MGVGRHVVRHVVRHFVGGGVWPLESVHILTLFLGITMSVCGGVGGWGL